MSGIFDLHVARFGDGASDLSRQACQYLDTDAQMAKAFIATYREGVGDDGSIEDRIAPYVINERLKIWEYVTRQAKNATAIADKGFRSWAEPYVERLLALL